MNNTAKATSNLAKNVPKVWRKPGLTLPPLPSLHDFVNMYRLNARRVLSQNYLMDMNMTRKIVNKSGSLDDQYVVEIGPGPGGITRAILEKPIKRLDVVEVDSRFIPPLIILQGASQNRMNIHNSDILKTDLRKIWSEAEAPIYDWEDDMIDAPFHIIGNLPFNIASPLIIQEGPWAFGRVPLTLTFQTEVAKRIVGEVDSDHRARISVMSQYVSKPKILFEIPGECFVPSPKINVGVVQFRPRITPLINVVEKITRYCFMYKRKVLYKGLRMLYPDDLRETMVNELFNAGKVSPSAISVQLGIDEISKLCNFYVKQCMSIPGLYGYNFCEPYSKLETLKDDPKKRFPPPYIYGEIERLNEGLTLAELNQKL